MAELKDSKDSKEVNEKNIIDRDDYTAMDCAVTFNTIVKQVFNGFKAMPSPGLLSDMRIKAMQAKIFLGINAEPLFAINMLGPLILSARQEIMLPSAAMAKYFLEKEYSYEIQKLSNKFKFDYADAIASVSYMKAAYKSADPTKQEAMITLLRKSLKKYAQYLQFTKSNKSSK